jgi:hypothetical protein
LLLARLVLVIAWQLVSHEIQLELIRLAHDNRVAAAVGGDSSASASSLAAVVLPSHVTSQLANARNVSSKSTVLPVVGSTVSSLTRPGNFLIAAAAQQRDSEMTRKRSRVAARAGASNENDLRGGVSILPVANVLSITSVPISASLSTCPYPVIYQCEL